MKKPILLLALAAFVAVPVFASDKDDKDDQRAASEALARGEILPIIRVLGIATTRVPGDVLKVKLERESYGFKYEVKVLARNGRVREIEINARTGRIIKVEDD